jgi:tyrosinase
MWTHEHQLRTLCSYEGAQPYWYEQMDAGHFSNSSLFDPVYGFGGDGRVGDRCITDGPFANYTNVIGPSYNNTKHCIDRRISDAVSILTNQTFVDQCNQFNRFEQAWQCMEGAPHAGGHGGVGGQVSSLTTY